MGHPEAKESESKYDIGPKLARLAGHKCLLVKGTSLTINPEDPPGDQEAAEIATTVAEITAAGTANNNVSMWVLGNAAHLYAQMNRDIGELVEASDQTLKYIMDAQRTWAFWEGKHLPGLSFTHHKEIAHMRGLPHHLKKSLAFLTREQGWSVATMRRVAKQARDNKARTMRDLEAAAHQAIGKATQPKKKTYIHVDAHGGITVTNKQPAGPGFIAEIKTIIQEAEHYTEGPARPHRPLSKNPGTAGDAKR